MLVRHFAEHPAFDCTIASRNPLAAEKTARYDTVLDFQRALDELAASLAEEEMA